MTDKAAEEKPGSLAADQVPGPPDGNSASRTYSQTYLLCGDQSCDCDLLYGDQSHDTVLGP